MYHFEIKRKKVILLSINGEDKNTMIIKSLDALLRETVRLNILYVEDNAETRAFTLKMLKHFFSDITVALDGAEGLDTFKNKHFDIIFTDINMPTMNGLDMIGHIRAIDTDVAIIIFSAYDEVEYFLKSISYGIDGYFLKPFDYTQVEEILSKTVNKILHSKKSSQGRYLSCGFHWDTSSAVLSKNDEDIALTKSELALFKLLSSKEKNIYSAVDIEVYVFDDNLSDARRVRNLLSRLKRKLECELIESIYGEGYRFKR
jgi:DNA-binding response OmpR family regulator